jgi:DNA-binding HxlR family transcriptional regulator/putative sterol carrier protein
VAGRTYGDRCGVARALDVVGERWALLVVRELLLGPKRFTDLHRGLGGVSQNVLSQRLRELERAGVLGRRRLGPPVGATVYELTEAGAALEPILVELGRWGRFRPIGEATTAFSVDAFLLALRTAFDPAAAGDLRATVALRLGDEEYAVRIAGGTLRAERDAPVAADAAVEADVPTVRELAFGHLRVADAVAAGSAAVEGDEATLQRVFDAVAARAAGVTPG